MSLEQAGALPEVAEVKYIPLETTEESLVGPVDKVVYHEGVFYLFDRTQLRVLMFDEEGHYIRALFRSGQGPGEYTAPGDMDVDTEGNLYIADWNAQSVIRYEQADPDRYDVWRIGVPFIDFAVDGDYVYLCHLLGEGGLRWSTGVWSRPRQAVLSREESVFPEQLGIPWDAPHHLFRSGGKIACYNRFSPFVRRFEGDSLKPYLELPAALIPSVDEARGWMSLPPDRQMERKMNLISDVQGCYEAGRYLLVSLSLRSTTHVLVDKETGQSFPNVPFVRKGIPWRGAVGTTGTHFISYSQPGEGDLGQILPNIKDAEVRTGLECLPEDSNPVLVLFSFR